MTDPRPAGMQTPLRCPTRLRCHAVRSRPGSAPVSVLCMDCARRWRRASWPALSRAASRSARARSLATSSSALASISAVRASASTSMRRRLKSSLRLDRVTKILLRKCARLRLSPTIASRNQRSWRFRPRCGINDRQVAVASRSRRGRLPGQPLPRHGVRPKTSVERSPERPVAAPTHRQTEIACRHSAVRNVPAGRSRDSEIVVSEDEHRPTVKRWPATLRTGLPISHPQACRSAPLMSQHGVGDQENGLNSYTDYPL